MIHHKNSRPNAYEKVQATRKKEAGVKKQPIIYSCTQEKIMFRVEIVILGILFNQVKIDGMTEKKARRDEGNDADGVQMRGR